jgi:hypothetical protein
VIKQSEDKLMARTMRMPTPEEVPSPAVRAFLEVLFMLYRLGRRPPLRQISAEAERSDRAVSPETIRRILRGMVPSNWVTVEAVLLGLCRIADRHPDDANEIDGMLTWREELEERWNRALDHPHVPPPSRDPWSDEPPF